MTESHEEIDNNFSYHPATPFTGEIHDTVRTSFRSLAHWVMDNVPPGHARDVCIDRIREGMMWANGAVACDLPDNSLQIRKINE